MIDFGDWMAGAELRLIYRHLVLPKLSCAHQPAHSSNPKANGTVAKLAMRQPFVLFKGLTFQKLCLPGAFRPG
ncbi:hypothetical protein, partial [Escherichia coli]|uniref:hypothetical protein n=1 Tax=Escherichia coli TaxID=562 RepID=UPI001BC85D54